MSEPAPPANFIDSSTPIPLATAVSIGGGVEREGKKDEVDANQAKHVVQLHLDTDDAQNIHQIYMKNSSSNPSKAASEVELLPPCPLPEATAAVVTQRQRSNSTSVTGGGSHPVHTYHHSQHAHGHSLSPPLPIENVHKLVQQVSMSGKGVTSAPSGAVPSAATPAAGAVDGKESALGTAYAEILSIANVENGLDSATVEKQRARYGFNECVEKETPLIILFLQKFKGPVPYMIIAAMAVSFGLKEWSECIYTDNVTLIHIDSH
jgi:magnesium-transporting ATPase (P-type)